MVIMICIGCAAGLAGLGVLIYRVIVLAKTAKYTSATVGTRAQTIARQAQELTPRLESMSAKQKEVAERLEDLSATTAKLNYLRDELDAVTGRVFKLKS